MIIGNLPVFFLLPVNAGLFNQKEYNDKKLSDALEKIIENRGLGHLIYDIKVPSVRENVLDENGKRIETTPGRIIFNEAVREALV